MSKERKRRDTAEDAAAATGSRAVESDCPVIVVGIGASTSGLESLKRLFAGMPLGRRAAFVLIQHMEPSRENPALRFLKDQTDLAVVEATDGMPVLADRIYVMPPDKFLNITGARLTLRDPFYCDGLRMPIDHFFCSLAVDQKRRGCGIVLSGTGSDGVLGLSEIKSTGGRTIVEEPVNAELPDMQSAIDAGVVNAVLPVEAMAEAVVGLAEQVIADTRSDPAESPEFDANLRAILDMVRTKVGHDFRCYKPSTLVRRIRRRMTLAKVASDADYVGFLQEHPDEVGLLQKDLLIGVTEFFRQPQAWEILEEQVIAGLVEKAQPGSEIRVWVPGCSTGKEAYSLAMVLVEQEEKSGKKLGIQIFATDSDVTALANARSGGYSEEELGPNVSPERRKRFFEYRDGHYHVIKEIRARVVFAPQTITADPPFSRLDLISCRNLLIYLEQRVQHKIIALFHFALRDGGYLFLGTAETVGDREDLFEPISKKWRIYRRIGVGRRIGVEIPVCPTGDISLAPIRLPVAASVPRSSLASTAQQVLLDRFAPACVMIDRKLQVLYVHGVVDKYLTFPPGELTTRVVDMAREGLRARLHGAISRCIELNRPVSVTARVRRGAKSVPVKATVSSLRYPQEADGLLLITFEDYPITAAKARRAAGESDIQQLQDELKVTREELQSTIDQLENSNDELKVSNEEVTASNEELQSANEELETSKEELQSLNEELNTINARLQEKVEELESANNDVLNLLASTHIATVFLDKDLKVKRYTPAITRLLSLIPSDLGRPVADVLRRFTDDALLEDGRRVLADLAPLSKEVQAEDGRWYIRRITPYRTQDDRIEGVVITFLDVSDLKRTEEALSEALERAAWLARFPEENPNPVVRVSAEGSVLYRNPAAAALPAWACEVGKSLPDPLLSLLGQAMTEEQETQKDVELGGSFYAVSVAPFRGEHYANVYGRDITGRRRAEDALRRAHDELEIRVQERTRELIETNIMLEAEIAQRKRAEEALRDANETLEQRVTERTAELASARNEAMREKNRLEAVMEALPVGVAIIDERGGNIRANDMFEKVWGTPRPSTGDISDYEAYKAWWVDSGELVQPDEWASARAVFKGETVIGQVMEIESFDGRRKFIVNNAAPVHDAQGQIVGSAVAVEDITDIKRAEQAVRDSEVRFRLLSKTAGRLLASEDPRGIVYELCREVMANLDCQTFFNFLVDERVGRLHLNACTGIPDEDAHKIEWLDYGVAVCGCVARDGERIIADDIFNTPDLRTELVKSYGIQAYCCHPLTAQGRLIGTLSFGTKTRTHFSSEDVALMKTVADQVAVAMERIKLIGELHKSRDELEVRVYERTEELQKAYETLRGQEQEISKARLMLQIIFDGISDPLLMVDKALAVRMLNRASRRYFQLSNTEEEIGRTCYQLVGKKCPSCDECEISLAVSDGKSVTCERKGLFDPERVEQITVYPVDEAASGFSGAIIRISDITESKNLEKHLMHVDRLSSLGQLSGGIAHEIRNPLAAINLFLDVVSDEEKFKRTSQELNIFAEIKSNIKRINNIIKKVLDFSRQSESSPHSKVELGEQITDCLKLWRSGMSKSGLELSLFVEDDLPGILGDPVEIQQVLNNLVQNAIEAMDRGGVLSITARKDVFRIDKTRRAVIISIQDTGSGIPVNLQKSIFNPFFTTKPTGTGLGLAISHRIISRHGGVISFESIPEVGTTFCVEIPSAPETIKAEN